MSDSRLLIFFLMGLSLLALVLVAFLAVTLTRILRSLLTDQEIENQRLRNQVLTMGDLSALERLNLTTQVQRPQPQQKSQDSSNSKPKFDPNDVRNTPNGPVVEVPNEDGTIRIVPLSELDPGLLGMGWTADPDLEPDVDQFVTPDGDYHAGPYQG